MAQQDMEASGAARLACVRSLIDALPSPALLIDSANRIVDINQAYCTLLGRPRDFFLCVTPAEIFSAEMADRFVRDHRTVFETGEDMESEEAIPSPDGQALNMLVLRRRIEADGEPLILTILTDVTALRAAEAHSRHLAYHDGLTGLPNRAALADCIDDALHRPRAGTALMLIDLYQFKDINDAFGTAVGDTLLKLFADRLASTARGSDQVARLGGDEFAVLLGDCAGPAAAEAACLRLLTLADAPFTTPAGAVSLGLSIGCAWAGSDVEVEELRRRAEFALYAAKREDGTAFRLFDAAMAQEVQARKTMESELRAALASEDQLEVYYQPVMGAPGDRVAAMEALVRWRHPRQGLIMPGTFIPIAESSGLIVPLGEWVLDQAATLLSRYPGVPIAVNLSPIQLRSPGIDIRILEILARRGLPPRQLQLEITESAMLAMDLCVQARLARLREQGVQLVLDDFGTGYSSLSHLHKLSIDRVKIDQSFVRDLGSSQDARAIIQAVLGIGQSLGIGVTAEGVEDESQRLFLRAFGCHEFQGYLFSRPLCPDDAVAFLESHAEREAA